MFGRKLAFWVGTGATAIISLAVLQLAAQQLPLPGLKRFAAFVSGHNGTEA